MKKDIAIIRDSISKVVNLLTKRSIKVTQRGSKAYVQYHGRTGAIELVNLPYLPDDSSDEFVAAVQGFLDHEVGHVLYTDPKIAPVMRKESAKVKNLANAIEDVYIERKMGEAFAGSVGNLNSVRKFYLDKIAKPKIDEAINAGDLKTAAGYASLVQFRAWGGQQMAVDFLRDNPGYQELTKPMAEKLGEALIARIKKASSSWECLDLARDMKKALEEPEQPPESDEGGEPDAKSEKSGKPDKGGEKADKSSDERPDEDTPPDEPPEPSEGSGESEDRGTVHTETDDSGKEREESSVTEEDVDPEAGGDSEGDDGDRKDTEDDSADSSDSPKSADDKGAEEGDDEDGEGSDKGDEGEDDTEEGEEGSGGDASGGSSDEGEGEKTQPSDAEESESKEAPHSPSSLFDDERDFDDDISKALTKAAVEEMKDSAYQIFSTDWDKIEPAQMAKRPDSIEKMVDKTQHMIASIQKSLERALAAKARKTWNPGQRRGRISPGSLFKTAVGDDRVFRTRYETQAKNTAVSLLVDCSGSMSWGEKIETAGLAAFALSSTLERLKISHEVIGFTTQESRQMTMAMKKEGLRVQYAREEALYMPIFKGFNERLTVEAKSRLAHLTEGDCHPWLRENVDGECLMIAARRLKSQRAERHLLIVLSDGKPACPGDWGQMHRHLISSVKALDENLGVEVVALGIASAAVSGYYRKHVVLKKIDELPVTVVGELAKVLLAS